MLILPVQGVDTVMAYEELSRPDTTLNVFLFFFDMSEQEERKGSCKVSKVWIMFS